MSQQCNDFINPLTIFDETHYSKDFRVRGIWKLKDSPPFLPENIAFDGVPKFASGVADKASTWHYTNAVYSVNEFAKENEITFPKIISVEFFKPNRTNQNALIRTATILISVTSLKPIVEEVAFRPTILKASLVSDMRTISTNTPFAIAYFDQKDWPKLDSSEGKAKKLAPSYRDKHDQRNSEEINKAIVIRFILVVFLFAPFFLYVLWVCKNKKTKNEK